MNDDELMTAVREPLAELHMTTPLDEVTRRGNALRNRRRLRGVSGVTAVAGAIAVAAALLVPGGGTSTPAAWSVTKVSDDTIRVTIRDLKDPKGLQRELRADGIPAVVEYSDFVHPSSVKIGIRRVDGVTYLFPRGCRPPLGDEPKAIQNHTAWRVSPKAQRGYTMGRLGPHDVLEFTIHASDYPKGTGLALIAMQGMVGSSHGEKMEVKANLYRVVATPKCLGS